jgi:hypothetical protein
MKKLTYLIGLFLPGIAVKAIAQEIPPKAIILTNNTGTSKELSIKEKNIVTLYEQCSDHERAVFLYKAISSDKTQARSVLNQIIVQTKVDDIISKDEVTQKEELIDMIRRGGIRWGSVGDPSERTR